MKNNKEIEQTIQKTNKKLIKEIVENTLHENKNNSNDIDLKLEMGETEFASFGNPRHMTVHSADLYRSKFIREYLNKESEFFSPYTGESKLHYFSEATNISQLWRQIQNKQLAIISADRQGDISRRKELQSDLKKVALGFTKVMGNYIETNEYTGEKERVYKESYIVVNPVEPLEENNKIKNFKRFKDLMVSFCKKYNQESVYIQYPEKNIRGYFNKNGTMTSSFSDNVVINDLKQLYYTRLKNHKDY